MYELNNKYWEYTSHFFDVAEVMENDIDFKFKFSDGKYSDTFLKSRYSYRKLD